MLESRGEGDRRGIVSLTKRNEVGFKELKKRKKVRSRRLKSSLKIIINEIYYKNYEGRKNFDK